MKTLIFLFALIAVFVVFTVYQIISELALSIESISLILLAILIGAMTGYLFIAFFVWIDRWFKPLETKINKAFPVTKKLNIGITAGIVVSIIINTFWIRPWLDEESGVWSRFLPTAAGSFLMGALLHSIYTRLRDAKKLINKH